ncbi:hypothetical protein ES703_118609 [subsurface metagenome]
MKFFIPDMQDKPDKAEELYKAIKDFAKTSVGWNITNRRIFRISYQHDGRPHEAEVGKINDVNNEPVIAILESNAYLVCTPNRGVLRDMPILVGTHDAGLVEDFETQEKNSSNS